MGKEGAESCRKMEEILQKMEGSEGKEREGAGKGAEETINTRTATPVDLTGFTNSYFMLYFFPQ